MLFFNNSLPLKWMIRNFYFWKRKFLIRDYENISHL
jgi:hypothetical protein